MGAWIMRTGSCILTGSLVASAAAGALTAGPSPPGRAREPSATMDLSESRWTGRVSARLAVLQSSTGGKCSLAFSSKGWRDVWKGGKGYPGGRRGAPYGFTEIKSSLTATWHCCDSAMAIQNGQTSLGGCQSLRAIKAGVWKKASYKLSTLNGCQTQPEHVCALSPAGRDSSWTETRVSLLCCSDTDSHCLTQLVVNVASA